MCGAPRATSNRASQRASDCLGDRCSRRRKRIEQQQQPAPGIDRYVSTRAKDGNLRLLSGRPVGKNA
ncbi:hypothetical protein R1flu_027321 [Riccia fluitans]|uniref:Uncharacterized protein n=1 Tax=Riccia fluitans TaxID=41844 RepID=A0ABD1XJ62_9MARC